MTIHCPRCKVGVRTPYRTHANTGPAPEGRLPAPFRPAPAPVRPAPAPAPPRTTRTRPEPRWEPEEEEESEEYEPPRTLSAWLRNGGREELLRAFAPARLPAARPQPRPAPAPARRASPAPAPARRASPAPAPARRASPAPAPAAPARTAPPAIDPSTLTRQETARRDLVCQVARSLSHTMLVWYNRPHGWCEGLDTSVPTDRQVCPGAATHAVQYRQGPTVAVAYACPAHARLLAHAADRSAVVRASVHVLK
ncbi:hypothetical protein OG590_40580 (plasmid) [Streptomyces goshikiensis]|uniref:hypothetical protein n=1 Tax=Streptomyces goshikiensis TaxID=1942 RepID=UPI00386A2A09|nr:hypothetical protein OG590_40580 [Streptomyces goshikiensis]